jgi:hypothetical protein
MIGEAQRVVNLLLELNVLNLQEIERELKNFATRSIHPQVKRWIMSVAKNYIINLEGDEMESEYEIYTPKRPKKGIHTDMPEPETLPPWAQNAVKSKSAVHFFNPAQPRRRAFWQHLETIVDWFNNWQADDPSLNRIDRISFNSARAQALEWREEVDANPWKFIKDRPPVVKQYDDGMRWVKLTTQAHFKRESYRLPDQTVPDTSMGHCVGNGDNYIKQAQRGTHQYYSLRDAQNNPHATLEIEGNKNLLQAKGKGNQKPVSRYQPYIVDFIKQNGWRIVGDKHYIDL